MVVSLGMRPLGRRPLGEALVRADPWGRDPSGSIQFPSTRSVYLRPWQVAGLSCWQNPQLDSLKLVNLIRCTTRIYLILNYVQMILLSKCFVILWTNVVNNKNSSLTFLLCSNTKFKCLGKITIYCQIC